MNNFDLNRSHCNSFVSVHKYSYLGVKVHNGQKILAYKILAFKLFNFPLWT